MYELDINFLSARPVHKLYRGDKTSNKSLLLLQGRLLYFGLASGTLLPIVVGAGWLFLQNLNAQLEKKSGELDAQLNSLSIQVQQLKKFQVETDKVKGETQALANVFTSVHPMSATLQELRSRIPRNVQIETLKQIALSAPQPGQLAPNPAGGPAPNPTGGIEISGIASSFNDVNDFLLTLQQSPFFKSTDTKIITAELIDSPISVAGNVSRSTKAQPIKLPNVVRYTIQASLSDIPASELISALEHNGALGPVARFRALRSSASPTQTVLPSLRPRKSYRPAPGARTSRTPINKTPRLIVPESRGKRSFNPLTQNRNSDKESRKSDLAASAYPTAKGIALPTGVDSALVAVLGMIGFLHLLLKRVIRNQDKVTSVGDHPRILESQTQVILADSEQLLQPRQIEQQPSEQFPSILQSETFEMMLLELYQMLNSSNANIKRFVVLKQTTEAITNSSTLSNSSLKLQVVDIGFEATAEQTELIRLDVESLPPLLSVKDYQSELASARSGEADSRVVQSPAIINTSFQLQALVPVASERVAQTIAQGNPFQK